MAPWLQAAVDQRFALIKEALKSPHVLSAIDVVMTPLTEPTFDGAPDLAKWDRTCDRCLKYIPDNQDFWTGHVLQMWGPVRIVMTYGVCTPCKESP